MKTERHTGPAGVSFGIQARRGCENEASGNVEVSRDSRNAAGGGLRRLCRARLPLEPFVLLAAPVVCGLLGVYSFVGKGGVKSGSGAKLGALTGLVGGAILVLVGARWFTSF